MFIITFDLPWNLFAYISMYHKFLRDILNVYKRFFIFSPIISACFSSLFSICFLWIQRHYICSHPYYWGTFSYCEGKKFFMAAQFSFNLINSYSITTMESLASVLLAMLRQLEVHSTLILKFDEKLNWIPYNCTRYLKHRNSGMVDRVVEASSIMVANLSLDHVLLYLVTQV